MSYPGLGSTQTCPVFWEVLRPAPDTAQGYGPQRWLARPQGDALSPKPPLRVLPSSLRFAFLGDVGDHRRPGFVEDERLFGLGSGDRRIPGEALADLYLLARPRGSYDLP